MSSREDLLEDDSSNHVTINSGTSRDAYSNQVTRFGSIQPKRNLDGSSQNKLTQSASNLQQQKVGSKNILMKIRFFIIKVYFCEYIFCCEYSMKSEKKNVFRKKK